VNYWSKCVPLGGGTFKAVLNKDFACKMSDSCVRKEIFSNHVVLTCSLYTKEKSKGLPVTCHAGTEGRVKV
jgi:hypothetical protein